MSNALENTIALDGYAQVIVVLDSGAAADLADTAELGRHFLDPTVAGGRPEGTVLASATRNGLAAGAEVETVRVAEPAPPPPVRIYPLLGLALGYVDEKGLTSLREAPGVEAVWRAEVPSLVRPVRVSAAQPTGNLSWGVDRIRAPALWDMGFRGQGVLVGHIDTGVDGRHAALAGAIDDFVEFDSDGNEVDGNAAWDSDDHGTHTAGTIVGRPLPEGRFGVAPEATLASAMVIEGGNVVARILGGMEWTVRKGARLVNASLGLRGQGGAFQALVNALRSNNILPVFAVGNEGAGTSRFPGNYHNVLSIGACDRADGVADFSGSQRFLQPAPRLVPDLVAPGVDILSCAPGGGFARMSGSSMATPHMAGLAALLFSAEPSATADEVERAIERSCTRPGTMDPQRGNLGIPDSIQALAILRS
jgi:subtilisin